MLDTVSILTNRSDGRQPLFRCVLTQTTRESVIAKHIRAELTSAGLPVLNSEMQTVSPIRKPRYGRKPELISWKGPAAREIAAIADEIDVALGAQQAAA